MRESSFLFWIWSVNLQILFFSLFTRDKKQKRERLEIKAKSNSPFVLPKSRAIFLRLLQMKVFRSKSCREEIRKSSSITNKYHCLTSNGEAAPSPTNQQPPVILRSYSTSTYSPHKNPTPVRDSPNSKSKRSNNKTKKGLKGLCEAEIQRKKRMAAYNVYSVEGKVKGSMRKRFKWFKETCSKVVYGLW